MADKRYVARDTVRHGVGGEVTEYEPGDELDMKDFTDEQLQTLVAVGSVLPKDVADALMKAEQAREDAAAAQADAQAKADALAAEIGQRDRVIGSANAEEFRAVTGQPVQKPAVSSTPAKSTGTSKSG